MPKGPIIIIGVLGVGAAALMLKRASAMTNQPAAAPKAPVAPAAAVPPAPPPPAKIIKPKKPTATEAAVAKVQTKVSQAQAAIDALKKLGK